MKTKRCTNSSCRRVFKVKNLACPYCGKKYPRESVVLDQRGRYSVILTCVGPNKLATIKVMRKYTRLGLRDALELANHAPSLIGRRVRLPQAEALRAEIRTVGGEVMIIPAKRGTKGVFVLPKKAG